MNAYNPTFQCKFYKKGKDGQWQRYKRGATVSFSVGNLTMRDEQGSLLADFPKAAVESFDFVKTSGADVDGDGIVRINPSSLGEDHVRQENIALSFEKEVVKSVMQELRRVAPVEICHNVGRPSRDEGRAFELPSLSDPATLDMIVQLIFDDAFTTFTNELAGVLEEFKDKMDSACGL